MSLNFESRGSGPRLVMAHGFTQNLNCWGKFADKLAKKFELILVDLPGHGESEHDDCDLAEAAELLAEVGKEATYLGYSMGGRVCLHVALEKPELVNSLILLGVDPGIEDEEKRVARLDIDTKLSERISENDLSDFLNKWLAQDMFESLADADKCMDERLKNRLEGIIGNLVNRGVGSQEPLWSRLEEITVPVLLMAGSADIKYLNIADRMAAILTNDLNEFKTIDGGHAAHLEDKTSAKAVSDWLLNLSK